MVLTLHGEAKIRSQTRQSPELPPGAMHASRRDRILQLDTGTVHLNDPVRKITS